MKASHRKPNRRSIANPRRQPMPDNMKFEDFEWQENQKESLTAVRDIGTSPCRGTPVGLVPLAVRPSRQPRQISKVKGQE